MTNGIESFLQQYTSYFIYHAPAAMHAGAGALITATMSNVIYVGLSLYGYRASGYFILREHFYAFQT